MNKNIEKLSLIFFNKRNKKENILKLSLAVSLAITKPLEEKYLDKEIIPDLKNISFLKKEKDIIVFSIMNHDNIEINNEEDFIKRVNGHILRGLYNLDISLIKKSNPYKWLITEFNH